ncbi:MAG: AraC family ligand binding domain-containing protein [Thermomicrobiales bacterium]
MRGSKQDVPVVVEAGGTTMREADWGEMTMTLESHPAGLDTAFLFKGLPDDRCQCPHWGYVTKGRMRVRYADREEVVNAGDAFYLAPGHTTVYDEETEGIFFSPKGEYQKTIEVAMRNAAAMMAQQDGS